MHESAFADAARPTRVACLRLLLQPYSIGHELTLLKLANPLAVSARETFDALPFEFQAAAIREAVIVCCDNWNYRERIFSNPIRLRWHNFKIRLWQRRLRPEEYPVAIAEFRNYLESAHQVFHGPDLLADEACAAAKGYEPLVSQKGRAFGAPFLARLVNFASVRSLHLTLSVATVFDVPFALAANLYLTDLESQGNCRIENDEEHEEKAIHAQRVAEELEREKTREARRSKSQNANLRPESDSGLATTPPDLEQGGLDA